MVVNGKMGILIVCITSNCLFFINIEHNFQKSAPKVTLQDSNAEDVPFGDELTVYDIEGNQHTFIPRFNVCSLVRVFL